MSNNKKNDLTFLFFISIGLLILSLIGLTIFQIIQNSDPEVISVDSNDEQLGNSPEKLVTNLNINSDSSISSPFILTGRIKKTFSKGEMRVNVYDKDNKLIGGGNIIAKTIDYISEENVFTDFEGTIYFNSSNSDMGVLKFYTNNEDTNQKSLYELTVTFSPQNIIVENIYPEDELVSGTLITGSARGWFFEGTFPVSIFTQDNELVWEGIAQSTEDWISNNFVEYEIIVDFDTDQHSNGKIVFENSNPSGIKELNESFEIPITF